MSDDTRYALDVDQLEAVLDYLPIGAIVLDDDGIIRRFNRYEEQLSGRKREKTIGRSFFSDVAPCTRDIELGQRFREGIERGDLDLEVEFSFPFPFNRVPRDVHLRAVSVRPSGPRQAEDGQDDRDRAVHVILIEDITSRRQLERSNAEMIQNLRSLVSSSGSARSTRGPARREAASVEAVTLWAHLDGLSEAAASLAPTELFGVIDGRLRAAIQHVERRGGRVMQVHGDGLLAVFAPVSEGARAIYDALRAAHAIAEDGRGRRLTLPFGVGLAEGTVLIGPIGRAELAQSTLVGAPVEAARALARAAGPHELLITEAVKAVAGAAIATDPVAPETPRWLADPGPALRLAHLDLPNAG